MHVYDPHAPYDPPPAFGSRFPGKPYEAEIATSDWAVGEVLRAVEQKSQNALVIVTADHGESLGEHGEMEHGIFLYDATLRVPLIMAGPMIRAGQRVQQQVRHVDILPTVADWVHAPLPSRPRWHKPEAARSTGVPTSSPSPPTRRVSSGSCISAGAIYAQCATVNGSSCRRPPPNSTTFGPIQVNARTCSIADADTARKLERIIHDVNAGVGEGPRGVRHSQSIPSRRSG